MQGPSRSEEIYIMHFNPDNIKKLFDQRQNDLVNFVVKDEATGKAVQVKDVNAEKTLTLFQKPFEYLFNAEYIPIAVKAELRQEAVAQGLIDGYISDYYQPQSTTSRTQGPKTTYQ